MGTILQVHSSARQLGSVSREVSALLTARLQARQAGSRVIVRDAVDSAEFLGEDWIGASFTPAEQRTDEQRRRLEISDMLASEVMDADILVLGVSMYNFGVSSAMKAWVDQIARPGITFRPDPIEGYVGLATGKSAYLVVATGETEVGGDMDFASSYLKHLLGFLSIFDVSVIAADNTVIDGETVITRSRNQIDALA